MASSTSSDATEDTERTSTEVLPETASLTVPASAEAGEAAAIAAAVGAHLRDRVVVGVEVDNGPEPCDRWKLCGRLGGREPPRGVVHGEEWKAAARSRW